MKKLLSLLAISATLSSSSLATISCHLGKLQKLNLDKNELEKELKMDVHPDIDPYAVIYKLIANLVGREITAEDIKNDSKILVGVYEDGTYLNPGSILSVGKYITIHLEVLPEDIYFQQVNQYTIDIGFLNKVTLNKNNINIDVNRIKANITTYADEYNNFRTQIANLAGIDPSEIATGSEKDKVLISLIVNGNAVTSSDTTFKYGDTVSLKIFVNENSKDYNKTNDWLETNTVQLKVQLTKDVIDMKSFEPDKTTYAQIYAKARLNIANAANINADVIKDGSEKDNVLISLIVNNIPVGENNITIKYGDTVFVKFEVTENSKYYTNTNGWIESNIFNRKAAITNISFDITEIRTRYGALYSQARLQIASIVGIDSSVIKNGSEKDNVLISIFINDNWVSENNTDIVKANDKIEVKVKVLNTSRYFIAMDWTSFNNQIPKATIDTGTYFFAYAEKTEASEIYNEIYKQIADYAGIDPTIIKNSPDYGVNLKLDGVAVTDAKQPIEIKMQSDLELKLFIHSDSSYYNPTPSGSAIMIRITILAKQFIL